jgi:hypothetical protein
MVQYSTKKYHRLNGILLPHISVVPIFPRYNWLKQSKVPPRLHEPASSVTFTILFYF